MQSPHFYETLATVEQASQVAIHMLRRDAHAHPAEIDHHLQELQTACELIRQHLAPDTASRRRYSECITQMKHSCSLAEKEIADTENAMGSELRQAVSQACEAVANVH
jgi:hypothetical protein